MWEFSEELDLRFSFKPAVMRNNFGLDCDNLWKLQSVDLVNTSDRLSEVFDTFETELKVMNSDSSDEHIEVSVDARIKEEWGTENRDLFPIELSLKFEII